MFARSQHRTDFGTISTGSTFQSINVALLLFERQLKATRFPFDIEDVSISENLDIGMVGQFRQLRAHHTGRAIVGGKGLVELGHDTAHIRPFFNQMHLEAGIGDIQGGLNPCNSAADNGDRSDFFDGMVGLIFVHQLFQRFSSCKRENGSVI